MSIEINLYTLFFIFYLRNDAIEEIEGEIQSGIAYKLFFNSFIGDGTFGSKTFRISGTMQAASIILADPNSSFRILLYAACVEEPTTVARLLFTYKNNSNLGDQYDVYANSYQSYITISAANRYNGDNYFNNTELIKVFIWYC